MRIREEARIELVFIAGAIGVIAAAFRSGSLRRLVTLEIKHAWLVFVSLAIQAGGILVLSRSEGSFGWAMLIATASPLAAFLISNRHVPGSGVIAVGFILNLLVIGVNRAMPVSADAAAAVGAPITSQGRGPRHEVLNSETLLPWLADVIPIPPLATVVSLGDIVLALGVGYLLFRGASPPAEEKIRTTSGSKPEGEP